MKKICIILMLSLVCFGCKKKEDYKPRVVEQQTGVTQTSTGNAYYKQPDSFPDAIATCMEGYKFIVSQDNIVQIINNNGQGITCN